MVFLQHEYGIYVCSAGSCHSDPLLRELAHANGYHPAYYPARAEPRSAPGVLEEIISLSYRVVVGERTRR